MEFQEIIFSHKPPARRGAQTPVERRKKTPRVIVPVFGHKKDPDPEIRVS